MASMHATRKGYARDCWTQVAGPSVAKEPVPPVIKIVPLIILYRNIPYLLFYSYKFGSSTGPVTGCGRYTATGALQKDVSLTCGGWQKHESAELCLGRRLDRSPSPRTKPPAYLGDDTDAGGHCYDREFSPGLGTHRLVEQARGCYGGRRRGQ